MNNRQKEKKSVVVFIGIIIAVIGIMASLFCILRINRDMTPYGLSGIKGDYEFPLTDYEKSQLFKLASSILTFITGTAMAFWGRKFKRYGFNLNAKHYANYEEDEYQEDEYQEGSYQEENYDYENGDDGYYTGAYTDIAEAGSDNENRYCCRYCKNVIEGDSNFCKFCGNPILDDKTEYPDAKHIHIKKRQNGGIPALFNGGLGSILMLALFLGILTLLMLIFIKVKNENEKVPITYYVAGEEIPSRDDMADTIDKMKKRLKKYDIRARVYQENSDSIKVEIPAKYDVDAICEDLIEQGTLYFIAQTDNDGNINYSFTGTGLTGYSLNKTIDELLADGSIVIDNSDIVLARGGSSSDNLGNIQFVVDLMFTGKGTSKFADATERAYAREETIGIYYNDDFISVPRVQAALTDGRAQIAGMTSLEEAERVAGNICNYDMRLELELGGYAP